MRFQDIIRTGVWQRQCKYFVNEISPPEETPYGQCQVLTVTDTVGIKEPLNYFFDGEEMSLGMDFVGVQWLDVRWKKDEKYFQCIPAEPPKEQNWTDDDKPNWDKIALGKCRDGKVNNALRHMKPSELIDDKKELEACNRLARFSMTGEIDEDS